MKIKNIIPLLLIIPIIFLNNCTDDVTIEPNDAVEKVSPLTFSHYAGSYDHDIDLEIFCTTDNATIYYTTNGDTPNETSIKYVDPIPLSGHGNEFVVKAIAMKDGLRSSNLFSLTYEINYNKVSTPQFNETEGTYTHDLNIEITCSTADVTIYYTNDGTEPNTTSLVYSTPIEISGDATTTTIKAIAVKDEMATSDTISANYKINYVYVDTPTLSKESGTYENDIEVEISTTTEDTTIYYTIDGSDPDTGSREYSSPVIIAGDGTSTTIKAIAVKAEFQNSEIATGNYTISNKLPDPGFNYHQGTYDQTINIELTCQKDGTMVQDVTIYYTLNGTQPTTDSSVYEDPIEISNDTTINAYAVKSGNQDSDTSTSEYLFDTGMVSTPSFSPLEGNYTGDQSITISTITAGSNIYYTTDGTEPTVFSTLYTGAIAVNGHKTSMTIKAIAENYPQDDSTIANAIYTINYKVEAPQLSHTPGTYDSDIDVSITCATGGAVIYYTTDGTTPTTSSTEYTVAIPIAGDDTSMTIRAIAIKTDHDDSDITTGDYTIDYGQVAVPEFNLISGTYNHDLSIELTCTTAGSTIYYTNDGTAPTASSTEYTGAIPVAGHGTVKTFNAIAVKATLDDSSVAEASYTIEYDQVAAPEFSKSSGTYDADIDVELTSTTPGAEISYKVNGGASIIYNGTPISISGHGTTDNIKAIARKTGMIDSTVTSETYTIYIFTDHIIVVGDTHNGNNYDWHIKKYDKDGVEDTTNWNKTFDMGNDESAKGVVIDSNNNVYVSGTMKTIRGYEWWIKKFDKNGNEYTTNWNKIFDDGTTMGKDHIYSMAIDSNNNIYVVGSKDSQWWIKKFNANGDEDTVDWDKTLGGDNGDDVAYSISIDGSNNVFVTGSHYELYEKIDPAPNVISKDCWTVKFQPNGTEEWITNSGNELYALTTYAITVTGTNSIYAGGYTEASGTNQKWQFYQLDYNSGSGNSETWAGFPNNTDGNESIQSLTTDSSNNIYITGISSKNTWGESDWYIGKYNSSETEQWHVDTPASLHGIPRSIKIDTAGNVYITGTKEDSGTDWYIRKLNSSGTEEWNVVTGGTGTDSAYGVALFK